MESLDPKDRWIAGGVPQCWYRNGIIDWPPTLEKAKLRKFSADPNDRWQVYRVKIRGTYGEYFISLLAYFLVIFCYSEIHLFVSFLQIFLKNPLPMNKMGWITRILDMWKTVWVKAKGNGGPLKSRTIATALAGWILAKSSRKKIPYQTTRIPMRTRLMTKLQWWIRQSVKVPT